MSQADDDRRRGVLLDLLHLRVPLQQAVVAVRQLPFDSDFEVVLLTRAGAVSPLKRYLAGAVTAADLRAWAQALEARDDVGVERGWEALLRSFLFEVANPTLSAPLTETKAAEWVSRLAAALPQPPASPAGDGEWRQRRSHVLQALAEVAAQRGAASERGASDAEIDLLTAQISDLRRSYVADLPIVSIARDPLDGAIVSAKLDLAGLDGPFWDAQFPARPVEQMPETFVVLSGAMRLSTEHLESTPQLCLPGPAVPFVVPELLSRDGVVAVLASMDVGAHVGYAVTYFSPRSEPAPLPNEWGTREYWLRDRGEPLSMGTSYDTFPAPEFELRAWIDAGKLWWVVPGDPKWKLRRDSADCPYLHLDGLQRHQRVQLGQVF